MASSEEYLRFVLEQLPSEEVTSRTMMGEYLLYFQGRLFGGVYDDRLLVKPVEAARAYMPNAPLEVPYDGAKEMLFVEELDDPVFLRGLLELMYPELPEPKSKRR